VSAIAVGAEAQAASSPSATIAPFMNFIECPYSSLAPDLPGAWI
jgi:hypothetical protein